MLQISKRRTFERLSQATFLLLFPGFFFYQTAIGKGIIPPVLGGYFGVVALATLPFIFWSYLVLQNRHKCNFNWIDYIFYLIMSWILVVAIINYSLTIPLLHANDMLIWSLSGFIFNLSCYFIAKTITLNSARFSRLLLILLISMAVLVILNIGVQGVFYLKSEAENSDSVATYQGFARALSVVGLIAIAVQKNYRPAIMVFIITVVSLFYNGARTEFVLFLVSCVVLIIYTSTRPGRKMAILSLVMAPAILLMTYYRNELLMFLPENRMIQLFSIDTASSAQSRIELTHRAIKSIQEHPLLGDYGSYSIDGGIGEYSHNLLSAWVNLGIVGFILYLTMIALVLSVLRKGLLVRNNFLEEKHVAILFSTFCILALIISKDYSYMLFGMMAGFCSRYMQLIESTKQSVVCPQ